VERGTDVSAFNWLEVTGLGNNYQEKNDTENFPEALSWYGSDFLLISHQMDPPTSLR
jgi:hypothetical protein